MEVILFANEKGGTAKTASVLGLANCLTALGYRVLVADMDATGNLSQAALPAFPNKVLYDVFDESCTLRDIICHTPIGDVAPTIRHISIDLERKNVDEMGFPLNNVNRKSLKNIEARWVGQRGAEYKLAAQLKGKTNNLAADYDFILIDSSPADNLLVTNAIVAADTIIIPVAPDMTSVSGVLCLLDSFTQVQYAYRTNVKIGSLLVSMFDDNWAINRESLDQIIEVAKQYNVNTFRTYIRSSSVIKTAQNKCKPFLDYMHQGNGPMDFMNFTLEFLAERGLTPKTPYPGVFLDEKGTYICRNNGSKYYTYSKTGRTATIRAKYFRVKNLEDATWAAQIGKTVFFSLQNLEEFLSAQRLNWVVEEAPNGE